MVSTLGIKNRFLLWPSSKTIQIDSLWAQPKLDSRFVRAQEKNDKIWESCCQYMSRYELGDVEKIALSKGKDWAQVV